MWFKKDVELLKAFCGVSNWAQRINEWCLLIKYIVSFSVWNSFDSTPVLFASQRKSNATLLLFLLECIVEQLLHKFLTTDVFTQLFFTFCSRGGSVCLSWLLEPSLSIKIIVSLFLFLPFVKTTTNLPLDPLVLQHQKDVCCCVHIYHHQAFCLLSLLFFLPFSGELICRTWLARFMFLWLLFENKNFKS